MPPRPALLQWHTFVVKVSTKNKTTAQYLYNIQIKPLLLPQVISMMPDWHRLISKRFEQSWRVLLRVFLRRLWSGGSHLTKKASSKSLFLDSHWKLAPHNRSSSLFSSCLPHLPLPLSFQSSLLSFLSLPTGFFDSVPPPMYSQVCSNVDYPRLLRKQGKGKVKNNYLHGSILFLFF